MDLFYALVFDIRQGPHTAGRGEGWSGTGIEINGVVASAQSRRKRGIAAQRQQVAARRADKHTVSRCIFFLASAATLAAIDITPNRLPLATLGKAYAGGPLVAYGGGPCPQNSISMRVVAGTLPDGLTLTPSGNFYGVAQSPGMYQFVVRAENACSWVDREFTLEVGGAAAIQVNPSALEFRVTEGQPLPGNVSLRVSSNPPGQAYTLEPSGADWMEARSRGGATPGRGAGLDADVIDVFIDSARLPVGTHRAMLRLSAWRAVESPVVPVTIQVSPAPRFESAAPAAPQAYGPGVQPMVIHAGPAPAPGVGQGDPHGAPSAHGEVTHGPAAHAPVHGAQTHTASHPAAPKKTAKPAVKTASTKSAPAGRLSRVASLKTRPRPPAVAHADDHEKPSPVGKPVSDGHGKEAAPKKEDGHAQQASHAAAKPHGEAKGHGDAKPAAKKDDHKPAEHKEKAAGHGEAKSHDAPKKEAAHKETPKETAHKEQPKKDAHAPAKSGHD